MTKKIIIANWKMNPEGAKEASKLFTFGKDLSKKSKAKIIICPPFPFISLFKEKKSENFSLGAQDLFYEKKGSYTGEVSASILKSLDVSYVIVGHSERRKLGETNELIAKKVSASIKAKITPILCIGEKERDAEGAFFGFIKEEILASLKLVSKKDIKKVIIAYEPLFAISTEGKGAMDAHSIYETVIFIKKVLSDKFGESSTGVKIIYGGSVDKKNIKDVLFVGGCDGALVGKASLSPQSFEAIIKNILL